MMRLAAQISITALAVMWAGVVSAAPEAVSFSLISSANSGGAFPGFTMAPNSPRISPRHAASGPLLSAIVILVFSLFQPASLARHTTT